MGEIKANLDDFESEKLPFIVINMHPYLRSASARSCLFMCCYPNIFSCRQSWEEGSPDYGGTASFDNILQKINKTLEE